MATIYYPNSLPENVILRGKQSLEDLQKMIGGGYIQFIPVGDDEEMMFDEEGKLKNLPINVWATEKARPHLFEGDFIVGTAVLFTKEEMHLMKEEAE